MTNRAGEATPAAVSKETKQAGEIRARWAWVEPTVWTERMLTALEQGVKGGRWFSLMDKVYAPGNLREAFLGVVDADLKSYFDTIPHGPLLERVGAKVSDGKVLDLVGAFLT